MDYSIETAHRLAAELRAMPAKDASQRRIDKRAVVKLLAEEILALQERGYTIEEVAESLRGHGLDITTPTLRNYLQRARRKPQKARRSSGPSRASAKAVPAPAPPESAPKPPTYDAKAETATRPAPEPGFRSGKSAFLVRDKESY